MRKSLFLMILAMSLAVVFAMAGCSGKDAAKVRVENVLNGLTKDDQAVEYQTAMCQWFDGSYNMNQSDLEVTLGRFEKWLSLKSLKAPIASYTVDKATSQKGAPVPTVIVQVTIDGSPYKIKVVKERSMEWVDDGP